MSNKSFRRDRRHKMLDDRGDHYSPFPPKFFNNGVRGETGRDDMAWSPPPAPPASEEKHAEVKWFNPSKGFGFVGIIGENVDAFLPASVLASSGLNSIVAGTKLVVRVAPSPKGPQVVEVVEVHPTAQGKAPTPSNGSVASCAAERVTGMVKMYNAAKGFGFVSPDDGGRDLFLHVTAVTRSGLAEISVGDRVSVTVKEGRKGPEVETISKA